MGKSGKLWKGIELISLFRGQFTYSVDAKGRVSIPAKLRKHISPEANNIMVMTRGSVQCIDVYPLDQWSLFEARLMQLNQFDPKHALFIRSMLQYVNEDEMDAQSRIMIPQTLMKFAGIEKDVLILGTIRKIELWNPEIFQKYLEGSDEQNFEQLAAKVMAP